MVDESIWYHWINVSISYLRFIGDYGVTDHQRISYVCTNNIFSLGIGLFICGLVYMACLKLGDCLYLVYQHLAGHYTEHENNATRSINASTHPLLSQNNRIQETAITNENHNADRNNTNRNYESESNSGDSTVREHGQTFQSAQTTIVNATVETEAAVGQQTSTPIVNRQPLDQLDHTDVRVNPNPVDQVQIEEGDTPQTRRRRQKKSKNKTDGSPPRKQPSRGCKKSVNYKE